MWSNLEPDLGALKQECFQNPKYTQIKRQLKDQVKQRRKDQKANERLDELRALENAYLYLISYVARRQDAEGWWGTDNPFRPLMTAHVVRLFSKMGVPLDERWSVSGRTDPQGNLYRAAKKLIGRFDPSLKDKFAYWGDDFWDDCYILLALLSVKQSLPMVCKSAGDLGLDGDFEDKYRKSLGWMIERAQKNLEDLPVTAWRGPGFLAAALELFRHPCVVQEEPRAKKLIRPLTLTLKAMLEKSLDPNSDSKWREWHKRFPWHAGQVLVAWENGLMSKVVGLERLMTKLYTEMKKRQNEADGSWDEGAANDEEKVYYTVRALSAIYLREQNPLKLEAVRRAHKFLLRAMREETPLYDLKACINAIDALDKLFNLQIPDIRLHLLTNLTYRLESLGIDRLILAPDEEELGILEKVREKTGEMLEERGEIALDAAGVNGRLFRRLRWQKEFLDEFTVKKARSPEAEHVKVREELLRFLSSTMTEVRANTARRLIRRLWDNEGYLNFLPLIEHLSALEHDGAFYRFYRDHLNHEVLLFALGAYVYFNAPRFRELLDREIRATYVIPKRFNEDEAAREFLFRWKMVATFHDIGYLFEVAPEDDEGAYAGDGIVLPKGDRERAKRLLLEKSFGVIDAAQKNFLTDYIAQYITPKGKDEKAQQKNRKKEAKRLAEKVRPKLRESDISGISREEDLFSLVTSDAGELSDAFKMIHWHIKDGGHIRPNLLKSYFDMCRQADAPTRPKFLDHGVMSALVLLKTADLQRFYLKQLTKQSTLRELGDAPELLRMLGDHSVKEHLEDEQFYVRFSHVAGAIALHNVYPQMYPPEQCRAFGLEEAFYTEPLAAEGRYAINLEENPLAYLTALADALQDWDRHSFRRPTFSDNPKEPISSSEVVIDVQDGGMIRVRPLTKQAKKRYEDMAGNLGQYMADWNSYVSVEVPKAL